MFFEVYCSQKVEEFQILLNGEFQSFVYHDISIMIFNCNSD